MNNIATKIAKELDLDNNNKEVIAYGMFALTHITLSIVLIMIFGALFNVFKEALIISFTANILRKYSGGAHAKSPRNCAIIGTFVAVGQALVIVFLVKYIFNIFIIAFLGCIIFALSYCLIYKLAPVDSIAKPVKTVTKKNKMRKGSIFILGGYIVIILFNLYLYIHTKKFDFLVDSLCIYGGTMWQCFTLTKEGDDIINKIDSFLNKILMFKRS